MQSRGYLYEVEVIGITREPGRLACIRLGMMERTLQRQARRPLQGNGRG